MKYDIIGKFFAESDETRMSDSKRIRYQSHKKHNSKYGIELEIYSTISIREMKNYLQSNADSYPILSKKTVIVEDGSVPNASDLVLLQYQQFTDKPLDYLMRMDIPLSEIVQDLPDFDVYYNSYLSESDNIENIKERVILIISDYIKKIYNYKELNNIMYELKDVISYIEHTDINDIIRNGNKIQYKINALLEYLETVDHPIIESIYDSLKSYDFTYNSDVDVDLLLLGMSLYNNDYTKFIKDAYNMDRIDYTELINTYGDKVYNDIEDKMNVDSSMYGMEIVTDAPISRGNMPLYINEFVKFCNDSYLDNTSNYVENGVYGNTGLHIHVGVPRGINNVLCDYIRVIMNTYENEDKIYRIGKRGVTQYTNSIKNIYDIFTTKLKNGLYDEAIKSFTNLNKGYGLNMSNAFYSVGNKTTIEYRYASSSVAFNETDFTEYFNLISNIVDKSFTGDPSIKIGEFTIRDFTKDGVTFGIIIEKDGKTVYRSNDLLNVRSAQYSPKSKYFDELKRIQGYIEDITKSLEQYRSQDDITESDSKKIKSLISNIKYYKSLRGDIINKIT